MKQGSEAMPGLRGRMITKEEFGKFSSQMRDQPYDALNTANNRGNKGSFGERKGALKEIRKEMKLPGEHEHVFVAFDAQDNVVGYLAVHTTPSGRVAEAEELRTKHAGHNQRAIVGKLLTAARSYLNDHGYPRLTVTPEHESRDFSVMRSGEDFHRFVRRQNTETGEIIEEMPEAANDTHPLAANENIPAPDVPEEPNMEEKDAA